MTDVIPSGSSCGTQAAETAETRQHAEWIMKDKLTQGLRWIICDPHILLCRNVHSFTLQRMKYCERQAAGLHAAQNIEMVQENLQILHIILLPL